MDRKANNVHVNPNFTKKPHVNRNFPFASGGLHINPNFNGDAILNALYKENILQSGNGTYNPTDHHIQPKIHVNPNLLTIQSMPPITQMPYHENPNKSKYVLHSKNKIIKVPSSTLSSIESNSKQISLPLVKFQPKKPSYSIVRNPVSITNTECQKLVVQSTVLAKSPYSKKSRYSVKRNPIITKTWTRKSNVILKNKYKICNNSSGQRRKSLTTPNKYKVCNSLKSAPSQVTSPPKVPLVGRRTLLANASPEFVYIRGQKFIVSNNVLKKVIQKSLVNQQPTSNSKDVKKISVSGVTYVRKSDNMFVVDNRSQNSVKKRKKLNITCPVFRRLGICVKHNEGKCPLVHNPKNISICPKFLKGLCKIDDCHLSHEVVLEKMPTCKFFLEGCCVRDSCPYLHVKVNKDAKVCLSFLQGYCKDANNCKNLHIYVCPEFYKDSKCEKIKCPFPHKTIHLKGPTMPSSTLTKKYTSHKVTERECLPAPSSVPKNKSVRYFEEKRDTVSPLQIDEPENDDNVIFKGRPKLGILPMYIALQ